MQILTPEFRTCPGKSGRMTTRYWYLSAPVVKPHFAVVTFNTCVTVSLAHPTWICGLLYYRCVHIVVCRGVRVGIVYVVLHIGHDLSTSVDLIFTFNMSSFTQFHYYARINTP